MVLNSYFNIYYIELLDILLLLKLFSPFAPSYPRAFSPSHPKLHTREGGGKSGRYIEGIYNVNRKEQGQ